MQSNPAMTPRKGTELGLFADPGSPAPLISVVVPVYREEANIRPFLARLEPVLEKIGAYEILFCLDPSPDRTDEVILQEIARNPRIGLIVFSRRFGQPHAVTAGLRICSGDSCVVIDVDLQDPPEIIMPLYAKFKEGYDVVYAKRRSRKGETLPKLLISSVGYWLINSITDISIPRDVGDFRVMSRRVIEQLRLLPEGHGFLRGLVAFVGFRQAAVEYDRDARAHGKGNYSRYIGSLRIGVNGLIGFSNFLLSAIMVAGLLISVISALISFYIIFAKLVLNQPFPLGIPAVIVLNLFMGGTILVALGIVGIYVGHIYDEVKRRPQFIIDRSINVPALSSEIVSPAAASQGLRNVSAANR
jgi:glycosyltransferase involved in cell wall biosynthesis